jgi:hypothetical protein
MRSDGTPKGNGYFGTLPRLDDPTYASGELSIGVNIDGKEMEIPAMVPGLTRDEINQLLSGHDMPESVVRKAAAHARKRLAEGKPVWALPSEEGKTPTPSRGKP